MKVSYSWLKEYLPLNMPVAGVADLLTSLGLEVSGVERVDSVMGGLAGVIAGRVLTCSRHPNADRLSLTTVDIGDEMPLQIVCGAPNVAADQIVWVAKAGTTLYPTGAEKPLEISKAKVRGETSEGMICALDELGLGEDHSGILVLPSDVSVGTPAADYYRITSDDVIEIELTPNRSDAISHLGVARDLAAWLTYHQGKADLRYPQTPALPVTDELPVQVEVLSTEACPRYCGITITGLTIAESPEWLQTRLRAVGVKPINNVVDVTNFVLHEMGQPLHAFDADKISGRKVIVRTLSADTPFVTLDHVERKLAADDLMICDGDNQGMCIAGVYGGLGTGITAESKSVFLESAHFHPRWIRRTAMRHDLRTDAARTFEKSTDPAICLEALTRAAVMITELTGGQVASRIIDIYPQKIERPEVIVRWEMISRIIGTPIPRDEVLKLLGALQLQVVSQDADSVRVSVPTNKADVTREADVIEEILRIYGYDNVGLKPRLEISLNTAPLNTVGRLRDDISDFLAANGFLEIMGLSLTESRQFEDGPLQIAPENRVMIENTSNAHLDLMRHDLLVSAIEAVRFNQNRMQSDLLLFEFGRTYQRINSVITESERLGLSVCGMPLQQGWRRSGTEADFFFLKKYVHLILEHLGITGLVKTRASGSQWDYALQYEFQDREICTFGRVSTSVLEQYDLRQPLFYADVNVRELLTCASGASVQVSEISKYPAVHRDIAVILPADVPYDQVQHIIIATGGGLLEDCYLFDLYVNAEALGEDKRSLAIALTFQDTSRTLKDQDVNKAVSKIVNALERQAGAVLR